MQCDSTILVALALALCQHRLHEPALVLCTILFPVLLCYIFAKTLTPYELNSTKITCSTCSLFSLAGTAPSLWMFYIKVKHVRIHIIFFLSVTMRQLKRLFSEVISLQAHFHFTTKFKSLYPQVHYYRMSTSNQNFKDLRLTIHVNQAVAGAMVNIRTFSILCSWHHLHART